MPAPVSSHPVDRFIWSVPVYLPSLQPNLCDAAISELEMRLHVKLPESYLDILRQQNGGSTRWYHPESPSREIWGIGPHIPHIGGENRWYEATYPDIWRPKDFHKLIPFDGDGNWHICFDYRQNEEPCVTYIDLETMEDRLVAQSFSNFLSELVPDKEEFVGLIGISSDIDINEAKTRLNQLFASKAKEGQGIDDLGYPTYFWPHIAGISPNRVPRSFVRSDDPRFSELNNLLQGEALRYPEFPDVNVLVKLTSDIAADKFLIAAQSVGFIMRRLSL
ncbi:SMI1/KNR4 family protein [Leeia sp. TBRC 13508]|uniref:SMI1/KNR4 family protein n=1 Tax=Leeia speluncae TaxID=2884804 RepID=A0ABS8DAA9_9NEIS|nr:SMI1/KNR4 family protein [Leeia speluncae]MCB6185140.1 SMI1/KNR4 family protein [Leeia speluncae]